jgi:hypothetical protein
VQVVGDLAQGGDGGRQSGDDVEVSNGAHAATVVDARPRAANAR